MDDTLRNMSLGLLALLLINGGIEQRARRGAERQVRTSFQEAGKVHVRMTPRGLLGMAASDFWSVDVYGADLRSDRLPFFVYPREGWKGSIRHLRLHFTRFTLAGLPVRSFEADIPAATFDISQALSRNRLVLRGAGSGPASVRVGEDGLRIFIDRKFRNLLTGVNIRFSQHRLIIEGEATLFATQSHLVTSGTLVPREGRYLDLADPDIRLNGVSMSKAGTERMLQQINPVLDAVTDLGLGGYFVMEGVEIGDEDIIITGHATIPDAPGSVRPIR